MGNDTLDILADAISDVGSWWCWQAEGDIVQMEFCDVQLYDESKSEQESRSTDVLAIRFRGNAFAVFLSNLDDGGWHERFRDDDSILYPLEVYSLKFDDAGEARSVLDSYKHRAFANACDDPEALLTAKHLFCARCDEVGFVAGGDAMAVVGRRGSYTEEDIESAYAKWCTYWKSYWQLRGTEEAYPKDYVCEVAIPIQGD